MGLRERLRQHVRAAAVIAAVVVIAGGGVGVAVAASGPTPVQASDLRIQVVDGPHDDQHVSLDATFFTPPGHGRVPAILLAHGFGETKDSVRAEALVLARAGFAVLTWSARGFGASTGQIALDSPDYEVKDVEQLVTWLARQPRVLLDGAGDPRVGITGASYGGAIALLAAAYDHRIDAIVPEATWSSLGTALFPAATGAGPASGVFKKQWASLLFAVGSADPRSFAGSLGSAGSAGCGRFTAAICAMHQQVFTTGQPTASALALLGRSSPASVDSRIKAPTLLIQGQNDSLFDLSQADANYQAIRKSGTPADMVWYNGGHDGGDQETARTEALTISWFDRWLKHPAAGQSTKGQSTAGQSTTGQSTTGQPGFEVTRITGSDPSTSQQTLGVAAAANYPGLGGTKQATVGLAGPPQPVLNPTGGSPQSMSVFPGLSAGSSGTVASAGAAGFAFDVPGQSAAYTTAPLTKPVQVTGEPTIQVTVTGATGATLFAKLYDVDQAGNTTLPYQLAAPFRVDSATRTATVTVHLPAIDYQFAAGHRLRLVLTTTDFAYATSLATATYEVAIPGQSINLPEDPALKVSQSGLPWWTYGAPAAAVAIAAILLLSGRRRRQGPETSLEDVPLVIEGLTKSYTTGSRVVDDLSLRVERGQIVGLLGPNGSGKTTTLRMLMGLIHPDAGTIAIFGQRVRPGAPALARLGSFVEGPGFLPHLSGRANLDLYWRATGRPAQDAHTEEVLQVANLGTALDRPVRTYSHGMRQRLAIAQAMLGLPELLVLDEPMNGLDPPQIRQMRDVLLNYAEGERAVLLSSHMLAEVEQTCTHVVVMRRGRGLAAGPVGEITGEGQGLLVGTTEVDKAMAVLTELQGIEPTPAPGGVLVHPNGTPPAAMVAALVGAGVPVDRVAPSRRLEDAFLELIRDEDA
jgi:ABC-2 type transport system ATP-binding protein